MDSKRRREVKRHLINNLLILFLSVGIAVFLAQKGVFEAILFYSQGLKNFGNFLAGVFFTSVLTVGPATLMLVALSRANSVVWVAFVGALGAVLGDLLLFKFVKDHLTEDFIALFEQSKFRRLANILRSSSFYWLFPILGALIIASPLPDEIGLAILGFSRIKVKSFIPLSFISNFFGIFVVGLVAKAVAG